MIGLLNKCEVFKTRLWSYLSIEILVAITFLFGLLYLIWYSFSVRCLSIKPFRFTSYSCPPSSRSAFSSGYVFVSFTLSSSYTFFRYFLSSSAIYSHIDWFFISDASPSFSSWFSSTVTWSSSRSYEIYPFTPLLLGLLLKLPYLLNLLVLIWFVIYSYSRA